MALSSPPYPEPPIAPAQRHAGAAAQPRAPALWSPSERAFLAYFLWCILLLAVAAPSGLLGAWLLRDVMALLVLAALHLLYRARPAGSRARYALDIARHGFAVFLFLPLAYKESGIFATRFVPLLEGTLIHWDKLLFGIDWPARRPPAAGWLGWVLEGSYLANFLLLLLGFLLAVFLPWIARRRQPEVRANMPRSQWVLNSVCGSLLTALLLCYVWFPLFPAITPRVYFPRLHRLDSNPLQNLNWLVLSHFSIPYGIFPSGHVAGPTALGCVMTRRGWKGWGIAFFIAATLIAVATVYGDYHFASDAVAGAAMGALGWLLVEAQMPRATRGARKVWLASPGQRL